MSRMRSKPASGPKRESGLLLAYYGDDFTGSTDALEQLTLAGVRTLLFMDAPSPSRMAQYEGLQAVGVAGMTRALGCKKLAQVLPPVLKQLKRLRPRHLHYKVCSTFDSSPDMGSIGRVMELAKPLFKGPLIPLLVAAPGLGRYTIFGNHFAQYGIGSSGAVHRLDRHPAASQHPVTPMREADLRLHLSAQTHLPIELFSILSLDMPESDFRASWQNLLARKPQAVLFDAIHSGHLGQIGRLLDELALVRQPLFSVGSSGIETALARNWAGERLVTGKGLAVSGEARPTMAGSGPGRLVLAGSGSCSPVTSGQIRWALGAGFAGVRLDSRACAHPETAAQAANRAVKEACRHLAHGRSVIIHTTQSGAQPQVTRILGGRSAAVLGTILGQVLGRVLESSCPVRLCIAGGDTSSYAARALGIEAVEMIAPLTPGAPLCRAHAPGHPIHGLEVVFKGGQVGAQNYFEYLRSASPRSQKSAPEKSECPKIRSNRNSARPAGKS